MKFFTFILLVGVIAFVLAQTDDKTACASYSLDGWTVVKMHGKYAVIRMCKGKINVWVDQNKTRHATLMPGTDSVWLASDTAGHYHYYVGPYWTMDIGPLKGDTLKSWFKDPCDAAEFLSEFFHGNHK